MCPCFTEQFLQWAARTLSAESFSPRVWLNFENRCKFEAYQLGALIAVCAVAPFGDIAAARQLPKHGQSFVR